MTTLWEGRNPMRATWNISLSTDFLAPFLRPMARIRCKANAPAELTGGPSFNIERISPERARITHGFLSSTSWKQIEVRSSPRKSLSVRRIYRHARSRKVAFRAHLSAVYLSCRRDKMRSPVTYLCRLQSVSESMRGSVHNSTGSKTVTTCKVVRYLFLTLDHRHVLTYYVKYCVKSLFFHR